MARRRRTFWKAFGFTYQSITGTFVQELVSNAVLHETTEQPTVIRILGRLWFTHERDSGGFSESMRSSLWLGITCMHENLGAISPRSNADEEHWMWTGYCAVQSTFVEYPDRANASDTIIGGSTQSRATHHVPTGIEHVDIDSRSMRKAPEPCRIALHGQVIEHMSETGASHQLTGLIRILMKE